MCSSQPFSVYNTGVLSQLTLNKWRYYMTLKKDLRNIGILAHIDAGKTTITEHFLYKSGAIRQLGRVDQGTAHTDSLDVERNRGISVRAAAATFNWNNVTINLIDTPGHVDFYAEVERALLALDGAILVLSAVEGVEAQTEIIWTALKKMNIPTIIFINKIDRIGANCSNVLQQIQQLLTPHVIPVQQVKNEGRKDFRISTYHPENKEILANFMSLIEYDEELLEKYLDEQEIPFAEIDRKLVLYSQKTKFFPILFGSALKDVGIDHLLNGVVKYLPSAKGAFSNPVAGIVFKIEHHDSLGKLSHIRLYQGKIKTRDIILNYTQGKEEKITQIRQIAENLKHKSVNDLEAGEIGILRGLDNTRVGDILGDHNLVPSSTSKITPLLTVKVYPKNPKNLHVLLDTLKILEEEDPLLNVKWLNDNKEIQISFMGNIQLEIISALLQNKYGIEVSFDHPTVIYKETPKQLGVGYVSYKSPVYATLKLKVEPLPPETGLIYKSELSTDFISTKYQKEVEQTVPKVLKQGLYGWEVTDLKVTLVDGLSNKLLTHSSDFRTVTPIALMEALANSGTKLLEPILDFELKINKEIIGKVIGDMINMRANFDNPVMLGDQALLQGTVPVATSLDYSIKVASLSKGRGKFITSFHGYQECPLELGTPRIRRGINPLDRSNYFLSVQKVIE